MVEYAIQLNAIFASLADRTRRDILEQVLEGSQSISDIAKQHGHLTFAAIAKHINVLEEANLIKKEKKGRQKIISANPKSIKSATNTLQKYQTMWEDRFNNLDTLLNKNI